MNLNTLLIEAAEECYETERFESDSPTSPSRPLLKSINLSNSISSPLPAIRLSSSSPLNKNNKSAILEEVSNDIVSKTPQPLPPRIYNDENDQKPFNRRIYTTTATTQAESKETSSTPDLDDRMYNKTSNPDAASSRTRARTRDIIIHDDQSDYDHNDENDLNTALKTKQTPDLLKACYYGNKRDVLSLLVKSSDSIIRKVDRHGWNALHWSCSKGYDDILDVLLHHMSSDMDKPTIKNIINSNEDISGWTPLHVACIGGHLKCIELLLQYGADKTKQDTLDEFPIECIPPDCNNNNKEMMRLLDIPDTLLSNQRMMMPPSTKNQHGNYNTSCIYDDDNTIRGSKTTIKSKNEYSSAASNLRINTIYRDDKD